MTNTALKTLQITVNGKAMSACAGARVADLVTELKLDPKLVAIEHNLAIVPRSAYGSTILADGDRIEIVGFIGGG